MNDASQLERRTISFTRSKAPLLLVPVLLAAMLLTGNMLVSDGQEALRQATFHHLQSVAEIQRSRIEGVIDFEMRVLASIQSRWSLRHALAQLEQGEDVIANRAAILRSLNEALKTDSKLWELSVVSPQGRIEASTEAGRIGSDIGEDVEFRQALMQPGLGQFFLGPEKKLGIRVAGPLEMDGQVIGVLMMQTDAAAFLALSQDHSGLGDTGEVVLARRDANGDALFLTPLRFDPNAALQRTVSKANTIIPINRALSGQENLFLNQPDYRGVPVLAVTQYLPRTGYGIVVKIDQDEAMAPAERVTRNFWVLFSVAMTLMVAAVVWLARVNTLAEVRRQQLDDNEKVRKHLAMLAAIVESSDDAIISKSLDSRVTSWNPGAEGLFGYRAEEIVGKPVTILFPDDLVHQEATIIARIARGEIVKHFESRRRRKDGELIDVSVTISPIYEESGRIIGASQVARDITARKREQEELEGYRDRLEDLVEERTRQIKEGQSRLEEALAEAQVAAKAKTQFLANMSHEIRTPMNSVLGFLGLALENELPDPVRRQLTTAHNAARSLLLLLNDILDTSKLQSGQIELEKIAFNLPKLLKSSLDMLQIKARDKKLDLKLVYPSDMPHCYAGDPMRIRQIVTNLVGNAIKFTDSGGITVSVERAEEEGCIKLSAADTGIGMGHEQLERIFTPFVQADSSTTRRFGGTGLGLSICKHLAEQMGGRIWADSALGAGSTFNVILHLGDPVLSKDCVEETFSGESLTQSPRRFRILLADDVEENVELALARLGGQGHMVSVAKNGREAVDAVQDQDFDVILMDVHMPEMNGLDATRTIRRQTGRSSGAPIIALTASVLQSEQQQCFAAGMDAFVGKPIEFGQLLRLMETLVPAGRGEPVGDATVSAAPQPASLPQVAGVDVEDGLRRWGEASRYVSALESFAAKFANAAQNIRYLCEASDRAGAYELAHALKGVAANLGATRVSEVAGDLTADLKTPSTAIAADQLDDLAVALSEAAKSIAALRGAITIPAHIRKVADAVTQRATLDELREALDSDDPEVAELALDRIGDALEEDAIARLRALVADFDFEGARAMLAALSSQSSMQDGL